MSSIYEWTERACALPGAPDIWLLAADGKGLITVDGDEGLNGIASDGTWWEPTGRADRPWVLAVDHPATAGCLRTFLGNASDHVLGAVSWTAEIFSDGSVELGVHLPEDQTYRRGVMPAPSVSVLAPNLGIASIKFAQKHAGWKGIQNV